MRQAFAFYSRGADVNVALVKVSFVIPLFNCLPLTQAMLASLRATLPVGLDHEIILVDDGSTDGTRDWLATLGPEFRVLLNDSNLGYARANNRAAALARGDLLVLLNNDLVLTHRWLEPLLAVQRRLGPRAGVVGNVQRNARTGAVDHAGMFVDDKGRPQHRRDLPPAWLRAGRNIRPAPAVTGACMAISAGLWRELGGFDGEFVNGSEDVDLCLRAAALGRSNAVALNSIVLHHISASPGRRQHDEENSRHLARKWPEALARLGAREWCWQHLAQLRSGPATVAASAEALQSLLHATGLRASPPAHALAGMARALAQEFRRWDEILPPRS